MKANSQRTQLEISSVCVGVCVGVCLRHCIKLA